MPKLSILTLIITRHSFGLHKAQVVFLMLATSTKCKRKSSNPKTQKERGTMEKKKKERNENETRKENERNPKKEGGKKERETTGELQEQGLFTKQRGLRKAPCLGFQCL